MLTMLLVTSHYKVQKFISDQSILIFKLTILNWNSRTKNCFVAMFISQTQHMGRPLLILRILLIMIKL